MQNPHSKVLSSFRHRRSWPCFLAQGMREQLYLISSIAGVFAAVATYSSRKNSQ